MIGAFPFKLFITKNIKFMKKYFFMAVATLVVSATAIVGVKAYNHYSMPELMKANLEALTQNDVNTTQCPDFNYVPNRFIEVKIEIYNVRCDKKGELNVNVNVNLTEGGSGILKGNYEKDYIYPVIIEIKNCSGQENGSCCDQRIVGAKLISC